MLHTIIIIEKFLLLKKDIQNLTVEERDELLHHLTKQSEDIRSSFAILVARTLTHLLQSDITAKALEMLIAEHGLEELADQIDSTDTISSIIKKARKGKYWSFFNYELVASIIKFCKKTELTEELEDYVSEFEVYCQHRVSEVPRGSLNGNQTNNHCFKVKLDDVLSKNIDLNRVKKIQHKLQEILKMKPLQLVDIKGGCIELTFRYFNKTKLFCLSEAQKIALSEVCLQWLQCGEDKVLLKKQTYTTPISLSSSCEHALLQPFSLPATTSLSTTALMHYHAPLPQPPSYHTLIQQPSSTSTEFAYHTLQQPSYTFTGFSYHPLLQQLSTASSPTRGHTLPQQPSSSIGANLSFEQDSFQRMFNIQVPPGIALVSTLISYVSPQLIISPLILYIYIIA